MTTFASFSMGTVAVPIAGSGIYNGYKVLSVIHSGRRISLDKNSYYYIPFLNQFVSFRGSKAKILTINKQNKYQLIEKFKDRPGHWAFQVDAEPLHTTAKTFFG